jgi:hypothetical protein
MNCTNHHYVLFLNKNEDNKVDYVQNYSLLYNSALVRFIHNNSNYLIKIQTITKNKRLFDDITENIFKLGPVFVVLLYEIKG